MDECKFIKDRWLNKDWKYIAIKHKGIWNVYKKEGVVVDL